MNKDTAIVTIGLLLAACGGQVIASLLAQDQQKRPANISNTPFPSANLPDNTLPAYAGTTFMPGSTQGQYPSSIALQGRSGAAMQQMQGSLAQLTQLGQVWRSSGMNGNISSASSDQSTAEESPDANFQPQN